MMRDSHADDCFVVHRAGVGVLAGNSPSGLNAVLNPILGVGVPGPDGALVRAVSVRQSANGGGTLMRGRVSKTGRAKLVRSRACGIRMLRGNVIGVLLADVAFDFFRGVVSKPP